MTLSVMLILIIDAYIISCGVSADNSRCRPCYGGYLVIALLTVMLIYNWFSLL